MNPRMRWLFGLDDEAPRSNIPEMDLSKIAPDALYNYAKISELSGLAESTLRSYVTKGLMPQAGHMATPDRPEWYGHQLIEWWPQRPGQGAPGRPKGRHQEGDR